MSAPHDGIAHELDLERADARVLERRVRRAGPEPVTTNVTGGVATTPVPACAVPASSTSTARPRPSCHSLPMTPIVGANVVASNVCIL